MSVNATLTAEPAARAAGQPRGGSRSRRAGLWLLGFALLLALAAWADWALTQHLAADLGAAGWSQNFEVVVNGEAWTLAEGLRTVVGWSVAALVLGAALLLLMALLPVTLGLVLLLVLLPVGLVLALVALPLLLVLGLLLSPLLLLGGLAWMIFG
jgi:hypothetical protein